MAVELVKLHFSECVLTLGNRKFVCDMIINDSALAEGMPKGLTCRYSSETIPNNTLTFYPINQEDGSGTWLIEVQPRGLVDLKQEIEAAGGSYQGALLVDLAQQLYDFQQAQLRL